MFFLISGKETKYILKFLTVFYLTTKPTVYDQNGILEQNFSSMTMNGKPTYYQY